MRRLIGLAGLLTVAGCSSRTQLAVHYHLVGFDLAEVVRVETLVDVDPSDARRFFADQPYRSVAAGVGIEVRDFNGTGQREVRLTEDATLGYRFTTAFTYTLLPPSGESAPPLILSARAIGAASLIGAAQPVKARFGPGASVDIVIADQRCGGQACGADEACCDGSCQNVADNLLRCGGCGVDCGLSGDSCSGGACRCAGGSACAAGQTCCGTRGCVDVTVDRFNCGACGQACNPGETCQAGQCRCGANAACSSGGLCCSDGSCSSTGSCPCGALQCAAPAQCCDANNSLCADLSSSSDNCGACGASCAAPLSCIGGACACQGTVCSSDDACCAAGCRTLANDPKNCGQCGNACGAGFGCVNGQCQCGGAACAAGQICCNSTCADPNSSSTYCGGCNVSCSSGETCSDGQCGCGAQKCTGNQTCCADGCFDLQTSSVHCGTACDAPSCPTGYACVAGQCQQTSCIPPCSNGNSCVGTTCLCGSSPACAAGQTCCSGACADLMTSHDHCMTCAHACGAAETCVGGVCKKPPGASCGSASECVSGHCSDGVCCDVECTAACTSCALTQTRGTCTAVVSGSDPRGLCLAQPSSTCGTTGQCGQGGCAYWPRGTACGPKPTCQDNGYVLATTQCNGIGGCAPTPVDCRPYKCLIVANEGAACAKGPCASSATMTDICALDLLLCAPGCSCHFPTPVCTDSRCGCP